MDGGWWLTFVFKSLDNNMICSSDIDVYVHKINLCTTKVLWVKKFHKLKTSSHENQIPNIQDDFLKIEYKSNDYEG